MNRYYYYYNYIFFFHQEHCEQIAINLNNMSQKVEETIHELIEIFTEKAHMMARPVIVEYAGQGEGRSSSFVLSVSTSFLIKSRYEYNVFFATEQHFTTFHSITKIPFHHSLDIYKVLLSYLI